LRTRFQVPFVGTVPAIKPACAQSASKRVAVLGTQATIGREYTRALIREFAAGCDVILVGSQHLAGFAESELSGAPASDQAVEQEIAPCFVDKDGKRTDTIVFACTHYPLLADRLRALAPWPVTWLDPAPAIARRVVELVGTPSGAKPPAPPQFIFTSGRAPSETLAKALAAYGFAAAAKAPGI
jgi:glutamate racemase